MFIIKIKDLQAKTTLGVYDWEQKRKRPVILGIEMQVTDGRAEESDQIKDTIDYAMIEQKVVERLSGHSYQLIERLVKDIGEFILSLDTRIDSVSIEADKPGALKHAKSVAVRMIVQRK
jgi:7,8-dihydroneopterin aldolase/epimerase/oxygenase